MNIVQMLEIIVSIVLLIIIFLKYLKMETKNSILVVMICIVNILLTTHVGITLISRENTFESNPTKEVLAQVVEKPTPLVIILEEDSKENNKDVKNNSNVSNIQNTNKKNNNVKANTTKNNSNTKSNTNNNVNNKGIIYLTFDDGPSTTSTPKILNILKKYNVKATFFILNYNSKTEALVKREIAEGHSVGIHGYSHDYKKIYKSKEAYMDNLNKLQSKIYKSTGVKTTITRFPGGSSNTISSFNPGIMTTLSKEVVKNGYKYYDWNVDSEDAGSARSPQDVYKNVTKGLRKNGNNVVLMHDFSGNSKTINALDKIIDYGIKNGYSFRPITSRTQMITHSIIN